MLMAALFGRRVDTVSIRPSQRFGGMALCFGGDPVDELAFLLGRRRGDSVLARAPAYVAALFPGQALSPGTYVIMRDPTLGGTPGLTSP